MRLVGAMNLLFRCFPFNALTKRGCHCMIVGLCGEIGSGKTTASILLKTELEKKTSQKFYVYSFASPIYDIVSQVFNIKIEDLENRSIKEKKKTIAVSKNHFSTTFMKVAHYYGMMAIRNGIKCSIYSSLLNTYRQVLEQDTSWWMKLLNKISSKYRFNLSHRTLLQYTGTDLFRNYVHEDFWLYVVPRDINLVIGDVRFRNEEKFIKDNGGVVVRVFNPTVWGDVKVTHASEQYKCKEDYRLFNNGINLPLLSNDVKDLVNDILGK